MSDAGTPEPQSRNRLYEIVLDGASISRVNANIEHEREVAIYDILDGNTFALEGRDEGPYRLKIGLVDEKLMLAIGNEEADALVTHYLSLTPFKRILKDYFLVLDSYYQAVRTAPPSRIQAIDMGRRGLHDDGSRVLIERLSGKVTLDFDTARRLFTLIAALHWKG
jgi:uncharacterized protein (UPF0262 family)